MLLLGSVSLLAAFLLAIELCRDVPGKPAFFAAALLFVSPLFFAQSLLAQLDAPAMLFTTLALLFFVQDHIRWSAAACVVLVLVKETGLALPLVLMVVAGLRAPLARRRLVPALLGALGIWLIVLARDSGTWAGNQDFLWYNLYYPLHPIRLTLAFLRRVFYLGFAHLHIIGIAAIVYACRRTRMFSSRAWRVALVFSAVHVVVVTALGGAVLERYLLPVMPVFYTAIAAALSTLTAFRGSPRSGALLLALAAGIYFNPPYSAPLEDNLAFVDYVEAPRRGSRLPGALVSRNARFMPSGRSGSNWHGPNWAMWTGRSRRNRCTMSRRKALASMDWSKVRILIVCNQNLGSRMEFLKRGWVGEIRKRFYETEQRSGGSGHPPDCAASAMWRTSNAAGSGWIFT